MQLRPLGRTDLHVSALCLGTMMYGDQIDQADSFKQMDAAWNRGINFFDTAELYTIPPKEETQGESERIVGSWVKQRGIRDKLILATKVTGRSSLNYIRQGNTPRLSKAQILQAVERSLTNLQTDYIDLYQTHWPDRPLPLFGGDLQGYRHMEDTDSIPIEETLEAMELLVRQGKIRHFGLSNETPYGVMRHLCVAQENAYPRAVSIQNAYNLVSRYFEYGLAEIAMAEQVGLLAYSPIAQGFLSGKYLDGQIPEGSRGALFGLPQMLYRYHTPSAIAATKAYVELATQHGIAPAALALQFVTSRPWVTSNIFGVRNTEQLDVVFDSLEIEWTPELARAVNAIHAQYPNPCP